MIGLSNRFLLTSLFALVTYSLNKASTKNVIDRSMEFEIKIDCYRKLCKLANASKMSPEDYVSLLVQRDHEDTFQRSQKSLLSPGDDIDASSSHKHL